MKRYLLDTGIMSDFMNHRRGVDTRVRQAQQLGARIGTCMPAVGELFAGIELSATRDKNMKRLKAALSRIVCWPFDRAAAEEFGRIYADLQRGGRLSGRSMCRLPQSPSALAAVRSSAKTAISRWFQD